MTPSKNGNMTENSPLSVTKDSGNPHIWNPKERIKTPGHQEPAGEKRGRRRRGEDDSMAVQLLS